MRSSASSGAGTAARPLGAADPPSAPGRLRADRGRHRSRVAGARRHPRRAVRRPGLVSRVADRIARRRLGDRLRRVAERPAGEPGGRRDACRPAVGDLRPEADPRLPARQAGLRSGADRLGARLHDRSADGLLQIALGTGRAREARQAVPGLRRRHADGLQADQRRRPGPLPRGLPRRRRRGAIACCRSADRARRSRRKAQGERLFALLGREPRFTARAGARCWT